MPFTLNQTTPIGIKGSDASGYNQNNRDGLIDPSSTALIYGGTALKITGSSSAITLYDKADATDNIAGFARYTKTPSNILGPNVAVSVAYAGSFMWMEAGATIVAGVDLEIVASGDKVITSAGTNTIIGSAETGGVNGDLILVYIKDSVIPA